MFLMIWVLFISLVTSVPAVPVSGSPGKVGAPTVSMLHNGGEDPPLPCPPLC